MEIISIEKRAYEAMKDRFNAFITEVNALCETSHIDGEWLDNQDVCLLLQISKRTLQTYRNNGTLPYSMLNNKCYYKAADIAALLAKSQVK